MSVAADTSTAFVDVLAEVLDDHETTGEDLAARMYLSRFHFDRLISSVAGEPPSDVHFHPPGSLRLPAQKTVTPMNLLTKMVEHHI
jgi:hypothetical protein